MKKILLIVLAFIISIPSVYAYENYGVLTGTVSISQPAPEGGIRVVVVAKSTTPGGGGGGAGGSGGGGKLNWPNQEQPIITSSELGGKLKQVIEIKEGETSAIYSFTYPQLEYAFNGRRQGSIAAYLENAYGKSSWSTVNISSIKSECDISLSYHPFYHISGKVFLSSPCVQDEIFTLYAESDGFVSKTTCEVKAGQNEANYTLDVIGGQKYTIKLFVDVRNSFYKDTQRGSQFTVNNSDIQDINFHLASDFKTVHGTLKLPDGYPAVDSDQTYVIRLSSNSNWLGQDVITLKKGTRSAEFLVPIRVESDSAVISWGLNENEDIFYSNGHRIYSNVIYAYSNINGEIISNNPRQRIDLSDIPENIEIVPKLNDDKIINIACEYGTCAKYDEITDQYSGTEKCITDITITHSVPLPQIALLCAYNENNTLLGAITLPSSSSNFTIPADRFPKSNTIKRLSVFLWDNSLKPITNNITYMCIEE